MRIFYLPFRKGQNLFDCPIAKLTRDVSPVKRDFTFNFRSQSAISVKPHFISSDCCHSDLLKAVDQDPSFQGVTSISSGRNVLTSRSKFFVTVTKLLRHSHVLIAPNAVVKVEWSL